MIILKKIGEERGDCTAKYQVIFGTEYTLKEFIEMIVYRSGQDKERGDIRIGNIFAEKICEFDWGKLKTPMEQIDPELLDKKIVSAKADGGWGSFTYVINLDPK